MKGKVRDAMLVGVGIAMITKETVERVTRKLMKKGELLEEDFNVMLDEVVKGVNEKRDAIVAEAKNRVNLMAKNVEKATRVKTKSRSKKKA